MKFTLENRFTFAKKAAESWKSRFCVDGEWIDIDRFGIYKRLADLGETPDPEDVDSIIGNDSWTQPLCDICDKYVEFVAHAQTGQDVCADCAKEITSMFAVAVAAPGEKIQSSHRKKYPLFPNL